jgi:hypothetical protein
MSNTHNFSSLDNKVARYHWMAFKNLCRDLAWCTQLLQYHQESLFLFVVY